MTQEQHFYLTSKGEVRLEQLLQEAEKTKDKLELLVLAKLELLDPPTLEELVRTEQIQSPFLAEALGPQPRKGFTRDQIKIMLKRLFEAKLIE